MSELCSFQPFPGGPVFDLAILAVMPITQVEHLLHESLLWDQPSHLASMVLNLADMLLDPSAGAIELGAFSVQEAQRRALDLVAVVQRAQQEGNA